MERAVQTWFNRYYGDCLGSNVPIYTVGTEEEEKRVIEEYNYKFLKPITYIATGSDQPPEDRSILNKALSIISAGSITDWIYLLNFWVNSGFYQYTGDISADYKRCVERTKADTYVSFATVGKLHHDIAVHSMNRKMVDDIPCDLLFYPKNLNAHYKGRMLSDLCSKSPTTLSEIETAFLATAETRRFIDIYDLASEQVLWPYDGGTKERWITVHGLSQGKPPREYFDLVRNLPDALKHENLTEFLAVKSYVDGHDCADAVKQFIETVLSAKEDVQAGNGLTELDDEMVKSYLADKYGIQCTDLGDLRPSVTNAIADAVTFTPELIEGSAKELMESLENDDIIKSYTLDDLVKNFCEDNNISHECTIAQLIEVINYEVHPQPATLVDMIATYMTANNAPDTTTFADVIRGVKHKDVDPIDIVLEFIETNELYDEGTKAMLKRSIIEGEEVTVPDKTATALEVLSGIGLPDDVASSIARALQTGESVQLPQAESVQLKFSEPGYVAGEYMLRKVRESIGKDASYNNRDQFREVLNAFLRLLMHDPADKDVVVGLMQRRRDASPTEEAKRVIDDAIHLYTR